MITEWALKGIEAQPSFDETVKIMDEMERLLNEMKEMMSIIKGILGEEPEGQAYSASINDRGALSHSESVIRSSKTAEQLTDIIRNKGGRRWLTGN